MFLPQSIQIGTIDYCNRKCPWCPESYLGKTPDRVMDMDVYFKILDDLAEVNYKGKLHLYLMNEPLCDSRIKDLIAMARGEFSENLIFISTNGDLLDGPDSLRSLLDVGLTWMAISDYDQQGKFGYAAAFPNVVVTTLKQLRPTFYNRGGHIDVDCREDRKQCEWVHQKAYINYKGDVILCCSDYHYDVVFGNVMERPFGEIYNGAEYRAYRKAHALGRGKEMPLCDKCDRIQ